MSLRFSKNELLPAGVVGEVDDEVDSNESDERVGFLSWIDRILVSPSDLHLSMNEYFESIDWDSKAVSLAEPLGNILTFCFYVIRFIQDNFIRNNDYVKSSIQDSFDFSKSGKLNQYNYLSRYVQQSSSQKSRTKLYFFTVAERFTFLSLVSLFSLNLIISYKFLCSQYKSYSIFYLENAKESPNLTKHSLTDLSRSYYDDIMRGSVFSMLKHFLLKKRKKFENSESLNNEQFFYQLRKWMPSKFLTHLFVSFSPTSIIFLMLTDTNFITAFALVFHQLVLHYIVIRRFLVRLLDESILSSSIISEMNAKIIKSKTSNKYQDVMVDATPYGQGYVKFCATTKAKIFESHTLTGELVKEKFNRQRNEFEDIIDKQQIPHNKIIEPVNNQLYWNPQTQQYMIKQEFHPGAYSTGFSSPIHDSCYPIPPYDIRRGSISPLRQSVVYNQSSRSSSKSPHRSPNRSPNRKNFE
ncbi:hypothetical protein KAFR_0A06940 [Kazachstania africana CBS 2517]|uniref:Nuclear rim protein 1 n=1 Tax=Kazachstania africana (strain ATCC 22294 / BCRC 22015 / CBS 2517 / CECT 1963 / NBRC 1671 / NRRL Y-8276) TaxID=1071382 RepID=H2AP29_KAZAF|nr:hypothetical protein KAFR_0A06940 [Kazachstania africana CBS 2517]CCF56129.1 hypothetical protein KAFR_0A06940 [Kazachstania africana CBS 2517]